MSMDIRPRGDHGMEIAKHLININVDSVNIPDVPQICSTEWNDSHLEWVLTNIQCPGEVVYYLTSTLGLLPEGGGEAVHIYTLQLK